MYRFYHMFTSDGPDSNQDSYWLFSPCLIIVWQHQEWEPETFIPYLPKYEGLYIRNCSSKHKDLLENIYEVFKNRV